MVYLLFGSCKHASSSDIPCPWCGGRMVWNGGWSRGLVLLERHVAVHTTTVVRQLRCKLCNRTQGVLERGMLPRTPLTVGVLLLLLAMREAGRGRADAARAVEVTVAAVRRADGDAERVALAVGAGVLELAAILASPAEAEPGLAAHFLSAHGTLPFSRIAVSPVGRHGAAGRAVESVRTRAPSRASP